MPPSGPLGECQPGSLAVASRCESKHVHYAQTCIGSTPGERDQLQLAEHSSDTAGVATTQLRGHLALSLFHLIISDLIMQWLPSLACRLWHELMSTLDGYELPEDPPLWQQFIFRRLAIIADIIYHTETTFIQTLTLYTCNFKFQLLVALHVIWHSFTSYCSLWLYPPKMLEGGI